MGVERDPSRKAVTIKWDKSAIRAKWVDIQATNVTDGDATTRVVLPNSGEAVLTFEDDYSGVSTVRIVGWREEEPVPRAQAEQATEQLRNKMSADPPDERLGVEKGEIEVE